MRRVKSYKWLVMFVLLPVMGFLLPRPVWSGVILQRQSYRVVPGGKGPQLLDTWKEYYQDNKVAVYQGNAIFITDIKKETLINIIPSRKIYAFNTVPDFISRIERIVKEVQQQPMFQKPDGKICKPIKISIKRTGEGKKVLGYPAKKYEVLVDGEKKREVWISRIPPLIKAVDFDKTMALKFRIENILTPLSDCKDIEADPKYRSLFVKGNIPMIVIDYLPGREEIERVTRIDVVPIEQRIFEPPKGFKKVPIEAFMQH